MIMIGKFETSSSLYRVFSPGWGPGRAGRGERGDACAAREETLLLRPQLELRGQLCQCWGLVLFSRLVPV